MIPNLFGHSRREEFRSSVKSTPLPYICIPRYNDFVWLVKECEFRFNYRDKNIYAILLNICKENVLF